MSSIQDRFQCIIEKLAMSIGISHSRISFTQADGQITVNEILDREAKDIYLSDAFKNGQLPAKMQFF